MAVASRSQRAVCLITLILAFRFLRRDRTTRSGASIDPVGLCLLATTTGLLLWPIVTRTGVTVAAAFLIGAFGAAVAFWFWERRYAERGGTPVLLPSLIASRGFRLGTTVALFWFGSILAVNGVLSLYLIEGLGFAPLSAALIMTGSSLAMALTSALRMAAGCQVRPKCGRFRDSRRDPCHPRLHRGGQSDSAGISDPGAGGPGGVVGSCQRLRRRAQSGADSRICPARARTELQRASFNCRSACRRPSLWPRYRGCISVCSGRRPRDTDVRSGSRWLSASSC